MLHRAVMRIHGGGERVEGKGAVTYGVEYDFPRRMTMYPPPESLCWSIEFVDENGDNVSGPDTYDGAISLPFPAGATEPRVGATPCDPGYNGWWYSTLVLPAIGLSPGTEVVARRVTGNDPLCEVSVTVTD